MLDPPNSTSLPLHQQLCERLIRDIASGRLIDGQRLLPEREQAAQLGVAVGTLRKALAELVDKGLLERIQGSGNYVRTAGMPAALLDSVYSLFRLEWLTGGGLPSAKVLSIRRQRKPARQASFGTSADAHRIRRLRFLDGQPAALEEIWLDATYVEKIRVVELYESLYRYYRDVLDLHILRAEDRVGIGKVPAWSSIEFPPKPGSTCGFVERFSWSHDARPVEYSHTWFDSDRIRYVARLG